MLIRALSQPLVPAKAGTQQVLIDLEASRRVIAAIGWTLSPADLAEIDRITA